MALAKPLSHRGPGKAGVIVCMKTIRGHVVAPTPRTVLVNGVLNIRKALTVEEVIFCDTRKLIDKASNHLCLPSVHVPN